ncbi:ATP-dependent sacrificial sulfur transferase LarE [Candidatus Margulisiibacteriota bacterium]
MKRESLSKKLKSYKKVLIAFSGGVDSTYLLKISQNVLGAKNVLAVIARSETFPQSEIEEALSFCQKNRINYKLIKTYEIKNKNFIKNPKDRCFYCKSELFTKLTELAKKMGINNVLDGSNYDDLSDYRPGSRAMKKLKVKSPLQEAGFTKADIRKESKRLKLPTWNKPSFACLSSRFPYGSEITIPKLKQVGEAEIFLKQLGFRQFRVRHHGNIARIEIEEKNFSKALKLRNKIVKRLESLGYSYVTLDLFGYRTGAMNEVL